MDLEQGTLEFLERKLEKLEGEVRATRASIAFFKRELGQPDRNTDSNKYAGISPKQAIRDYLESEGAPRTGEEIIRALKNGGNFEGKRKGSGEFALRQNLQFGNLVLHEGGRIVTKAQIDKRLDAGEIDLLNAMIGLAEWKQK